MPDERREVVPADPARRLVGHRRLRRVLSTVGAALALFGTSARAQTVPPRYTCPHRVAWDANEERDVAGYVLAWGRGARAYSRSVTVGIEATAATLYVPHGTTYVGVLALNTDRVASEFGNEIALTCRIGDTRLPPRVTGSVTGVIVRGTT